MPRSRFAVGEFSSSSDPQPAAATSANRDSQPTARNPTFVLLLIASPDGTGRVGCPGSRLRTGPKARLRSGCQDHQRRETWAAEAGIAVPTSWRHSGEQTFRQLPATGPGRQGDSATGWEGGAAAALKAGNSQESESGHRLLPPPLFRPTPHLRASTLIRRNVSKQR